MPMIPIGNVLPHVQNLRSVKIIKEDELPKGEFGLNELYCNDVNCDCRRVIISVFDENNIYATINYGWESQDFYRKWSTNIDEDMKGPSLELFGPQSEYANAFLRLFKEFVTHDLGYVKRLESHYIEFKRALKKMPEWHASDEEATRIPITNGIHIGRNEPCPCGSGKKYKKCCLGQGTPSK